MEDQENTTPRIPGVVLVEVEGVKDAIACKSCKAWLLPVHESVAEGAGRCPTVIDQCAETQRRLEVEGGALVPIGTEYIRCGNCGSGKLAPSRIKEGKRQYNCEDCGQTVLFPIPSD